MPAIAKTKCDACGNQHDFCLANAGGFKRPRAYGYICPATNQPAQFVLRARIEKYRADCPEGAVTVREIGLP